MPLSKLLQPGWWQIKAKKAGWSGRQTLLPSLKPLQKVNWGQQTLEMLLATAPRTREQDPASRLAGHIHRPTKRGQRGGRSEVGRPAGPE